MRAARRATRPRLPVRRRGRAGHAAARSRPAVAAARANPTLRAAFDFAIDTERRAPDTVAQCLAGARVAAFSVYSWNWRLSLAVARAAAALDPDVFVVFGGPCVPRRPERAAAFSPSTRMSMRSSSEKASSRFAHSFRRCSEAGAPRRSLALLSRGGRCARALARPRLHRTGAAAARLHESRFTVSRRHVRRAGRATPSRSRSPSTRLHAAIVETNRGCPFTCTFCDWGQAVHTRVHELPLERVQAELEWIAHHGLPYVYIADANFGIRPRDLAIVQHLGELRRVHEAPLFCYFHLTKNATERNLATVAALHAAGVGCQVRDLDARHGRTRARGGASIEHHAGPSAGDAPRLQRPGHSDAE